MLSYTGITSLDGYINDASGNFDWSTPDEEVHWFVNRLERPVRTHLLGRRMYEVLSAWETMPPEPEHPFIDDYAEIWRSADKIVFSRTLESVSTARTTIEREFDLGLLDTLEGEIAIGGPTLAAQAFDRIDEFRMLVSPVIVGAGTPYLPPGAAASLQLVEERRFGNGVVFLRYRRAHG